MAPDTSSYLLTSGYQLDAEYFPELGVASPAHFYTFVPVAQTPAPPEIIYVPKPNGVNRAAFGLALSSWNLLWEGAGFQRDVLEGDRDWPESLRWVFEERHGNRNFYLLPLTKLRWGAYDSLFRLLPLDVLRRHDLPALKRSIWPHYPWNVETIEPLLPKDFLERLGNAFAAHIWRLLNPRSPQRAFGKKNSVRLLAHNLDFWVPYAELMIQERARALGRVDYDDERPDQARIHRRLVKQYKGAPFRVERPLRGGHLWMGEAEAWEATQRVVELADRGGHLQAILDAFRSHRVEDDFSSLWSHEREDFERKLYAKRSKIKVSFVELRDTLPVHGPDSECHENILWSDFMALLDPQERAVVVCLRSGSTQLEIASRLGYANHSPVSKALARIRRKARTFLNS